MKPTPHRSYLITAIVSNNDIDTKNKLELNFVIKENSYNMRKSILKAYLKKKRLNLLHVEDGILSDCEVVKLDGVKKLDLHQVYRGDFITAKFSKNKIV